MNNSLHNIVESVREDKYKDKTLDELVVSYMDNSSEGLFAEIINKVEPLIYKIANKYESQLGFDNCISYLYESLLMSLRSFKTDKKVKFITYCYGNFERFMIVKAKESNRQFRRINYNTVSTSMINKNDEELDTYDLFAYYDKGFDTAEFKYTINNLNLSKKQKLILYYMFNGYSYKEISEKLNVTYAYVISNKNKIKNQLKECYSI